MRYFPSLSHAATALARTLSRFCTYMHTYIQRHNLCTYNPWIRVSQRQQDVEQVINTQIYTIFTVSNAINVYRTVLKIIFTYKNSAKEYKESVFNYFLYVTSNFAFSLLRIIRPCSKLLEVMKPTYNVILLETRQVGIWSMKMVLIPCIHIIHTRTYPYRCTVHIVELFN